MNIIDIHILMCYVIFLYLNTFAYLQYNQWRMQDFFQGGGVTLNACHDRWGGGDSDTSFSILKSFGSIFQTQSRGIHHTSSTSLTRKQGGGGNLWVQPPPPPEFFFGIQGGWTPYPPPPPCMRAWVQCIPYFHKTIYLLTHLSIHLSIYLHVYLPVYLPIYLSSCLFFCLSPSPHLTSPLCHPRESHPPSLTFNQGGPIFNHCLWKVKRTGLN